MFDDEVIDRNMHWILQNLKINAHVCIYIIAHQNVHVVHCVEFAFLGGKLGRFLMLASKNEVFETYCISKVKVKVDYTPITSFLDI